MAVPEQCISSGRAAFLNHILSLTQPGCWRLDFWDGAWVLGFSELKAGNVVWAQWAGCNSCGGSLGVKEYVIGTVSILGLFWCSRGWFGHGCI